MRKSVKLSPEAGWTPNAPYSGPKPTIPELVNPLSLSAPLILLSVMEDGSG